MDRGAQRTTVHGVAKSQTLLSNLLLTFVILKAEILKNLLTVSKEIKPVNPKGNQSWIFFVRTNAEAPILWPPDAKSWLIRKTPDAGKDWRQEEKGTTEDEMVGWYHRLHGHEFEQALGVGDGQRSLACCSPWGCRVRHDWVTELNWRTVRSPLSESSLKVNFIWSLSLSLSLYIYISYIYIYYIYIW